MAERRGYFGVGIVSGKSPENVGGLWRSAHCFGAALIFTVAFRPPRQPTDTTKAARHVPLIAYPDIDTFLRARPEECELVAVECGVGGKQLPAFRHPERALYVLGPEDGSLNKAMLDACDGVVEIPTQFCLNVATAGALVIYDRVAKAGA
jgi:tRNA(Leu) C34 or U34 (ribose-2'-O)-methylase TrmL